jgi:hypothetical protein
MADDSTIAFGLSVVVLVVAGIAVLGRDAAAAAPTINIPSDFGQDSSEPTPGGFVDEIPDVDDTGDDEFEFREPEDATDTDLDFGSDDVQMPDRVDPDPNERTAFSPAEIRRRLMGDG